jgi:hypothetical protein
MKSLFRITASAVCFYLAACNTIVTETIDPATGKVIGRTTTTTVDSGAVTAGASTVAIIAAPRVRAEK